MNDIDLSEQEMDTYTQERVPFFERVIRTGVALVQEATSFLTIYLSERCWFLLPSVVPAIVALICASYVFIWCIAQPDERVVSRLKTQLGQAVVHEDLGRRRICVLALLQRSPEEPECRFAYALLLRDEGRTNASHVLLEQLAPADAIGFGPAHRLLAEDALSLLRSTDTETDRQELTRLAIHHMESARQTDDPQWDYQLGKLYVENGQILLAELRMRRAALAGYGPAQMVLSRFERRRGDEVEADRLVRAAQQGLESYVIEHLDDLDARLAWAECLVELRDWPALDQALGVLRRDSGTGRYREQLARLYLTASQKQPAGSVAMRSATVQYALRAFELLEDPTPAAWRLVELKRLHFAVEPEYLTKVRDWQRGARPSRSTDATWLQLGACLAESLDDTDAAEEGFRAAAQFQPKAISELASFYRRQGDTEKLWETSGLVIETFEMLPREVPGDTAVGIILATAYADRQRWEDARSVLISLGDDAQAAATLAALCIREYDSHTTSIERFEHSEIDAQLDREDLQKAEAIHRCELLRQALWAVPNFPPAVKRLRNELFNESTSGDNRMQQFLIAMLAEGDQPLAIHQLLGVQAAANGQWSDAVRHFEQVHHLYPDDPFILNNLAYALLQGESSRESLRRANELVCKALHLAAGHPELLATRGEILARMGDDVGAVADLESALQTLPGERPKLHDVLAHCYRRLGMEAMYREHLLRGSGKSLD